jgi:cytochrome c oxidase subunit 3
MDTARLGMLLALAGISMLFIAITSSYVVGHGFRSTWNPLPMPWLLPLNTMILLLASATIERSRRVSRDKWLAATLLLGIAFLAGQLAVWRQLAAGGIYLGSNPHGSFFYLLTGLHGLHVLGGVVAVGYLKLRAWRPDVTALYWHFMGGLWVYLVLLLFAWR